MSIPPWAGKGTDFGGFLTRAEQLGFPARGGSRGQEGGRTGSKIVALGLLLEEVLVQQSAHLLEVSFVFGRERRGAGRSRRGTRAADRRPRGCRRPGRGRVRSRSRA